MGSREKFVLLDGMSLVFRAYHALSRANLQSPVTGEPTYAVFGFANMLATLLEKIQPHYIVAAFDTAEPTVRHEQYEAYKANRPEFPEDLVPQLLRIKELLIALRIPILEMPGYEADDIIGSLAKKAAAQGLDVYCVTSDKDFFQLVNAHIKIFRPGIRSGEYEIIDGAKVRQRYGIEPSQFVDFLALVGDPVDNVPGVKGIGEKTARMLIATYGSLEAVYQHLEELSPSIRKKLEQYRDEAFLSRELVTIHTDLDIPLDLERFRLQKPDYAQLHTLFDQLGFHRLRERFGLPDAEAVTQKTDFQTIADRPHQYTLVNSFSLLQAMLTELQQAEWLAVDTETSSLEPMRTKLVGISLSNKVGRAWYIPIFGAEDHFVDDRWRMKGERQGHLFAGTGGATNGSIQRTILQQLQPILENAHILKTGQNIKFDLLVLRRYGIQVQPVKFDTMVASYVLNPDASHNLEALAERWLHYKPISIATLIGERRKGQISMTEVSVSDVYPYACEDADITLQLTYRLREELEKENLLHLAETIEFPLIEVLTTMEYNGIAIDQQVLQEISVVLEQRIQELKKKIFEEAGMSFNIDSPKQLAHVLFEKLMIPPIKKTKTGYSTDASVLEELARSYPIAQYILEYRQLTKLKSTYVDALPRYIHPETGCIHTTFNQTVTSTGRLSSSNPNLQNIPARGELGMEIRQAFVPRSSDRWLLSADYSQIELRLMAYFSGDEHLIAAFREGLDIHTATAARLFGVPMDQVTPDMRRKAKTVNFGIMYGLGPYGLAQQLRISRTEARQIIEQYFQTYPGIRRYIEETLEKVRKQGYAETLFGRRRYFPNINSHNATVRKAEERAAINMPLQGTAADMIKLAMIRVHHRLQEQYPNSLLCLQVHDELVLDISDADRHHLPDEVKNIMESVVSLGEVPIVVDIGIGKNWAEAHG